MSEQEQRNRDALERNGGPTIRRIVVAISLNSAKLVPMM